MPGTVRKSGDTEGLSNMMEHTCSECVIVSESHLILFFPLLLLLHHSPPMLADKCSHLPYPKNDERSGKDVEFVATWTMFKSYLNLSGLSSSNCKMGIKVITMSCGFWGWETK